MKASKLSQLKQNITSRSRNTNRLLQPSARRELNRLKFEIADDLGVELGPETSSRDNGTVGGLMVKTMIDYAQRHMKEALANNQLEEYADVYPLE